MGTLADQLEVPVTKASRGLSPPSHFPARFRSLVDSTCYNAARHAWRTSSRPRELPPQYRVTGGSYPPPVPTERSVRISRTTLFEN